MSLNLNKLVSMMSNDILKIIYFNYSNICCLEGKRKKLNIKYNKINNSFINYIKKIKTGQSLLDYDMAFECNFDPNSENYYCCKLEDKYCDNGYKFIDQFVKIKIENGVKVYYYSDYDYGEIKNGCNHYIPPRKVNIMYDDEIIYYYMGAYVDYIKHDQYR